MFGESVVCRVLDRSVVSLDLGKVGMNDETLDAFRTVMQRPNGIILVTGPTGSGKTTTLYSALSQINTIDTNIMTAEDPVEYNIHGINQVLVRTEIGMTFAAALRAFLRQDPNIIMVGEIRDLETGGIAIKAALTGHLVLSTLHTNDTPSTVTRLIDMGLEPFNVASALNLLSAQRLARRICTKCKAETTYAEEFLVSARIPLDWAEATTFYKGEGCDACADTGYKGRCGFYEVMILSSSLRKAIMQEASTDELRVLACSEGMLTLREDGMKKVERGVTTLDELVKETSVAE
jgi:type IV pilus assembly protein PilB